MDAITSFQDCSVYEFRPVFACYDDIINTPEKFGRGLHLTKKNKMKEERKRKKKKKSERSGLKC